MATGDYIECINTGNPWNASRAEIRTFTNQRVNVDMNGEFINTDLKHPVSFIDSEGKEHHFSLSHKDLSYEPTLKQCAECGSIDVVFDDHNEHEFNCCETVCKENNFRNKHSRLEPIE